MSLISRLSNIFATEPSSHPRPAPEAADGGQQDADRRHGTDFAIVRKLEGMRTVEETQAEEELRSRRPPYLHVS